MRKNVHDGHRDRLRNEFLASSNTHAIPKHKLLEMLLFYGIPRKDTNEIAHNLIDKFGSFHAVFEADISELTSISGMTKNAATLIKLMVPIATTYIDSRYEDDIYLHSLDEIGNFIHKKYFGISSERCTLLSLNNKGKVLSFDILAEGDIDSVGLSIRSVVEKIINTNASAVVLAHNHPGGTALPSEADVIMTLAISKALQTVSVKFSDHIIIVDDDYISMAQSGKYKEMFD